MKQKQKNQNAQSHDGHMSMADKRVSEGVYNNKPLTKSEINWIKRLEKVLSKKPKGLVGFLHNGESVDFYREGWKELYEKDKCPEPLMSIYTKGIDGGAY